MFLIWVKEKIFRASLPWILPECCTAVVSGEGTALLKQITVSMCFLYIQGKGFCRLIEPIC
jgi:hypothetical protein